MKAKRTFRLELWKVAIFLVVALLITGFVLIYGSIRHKLKIERIYNQITECVGTREITMYGEYNDQTVKISLENRGPIWEYLTDRNIEFTTIDDMPDVEPIIVQFDDKLEMDIYPMEDYKVFVKHVDGKKVIYYIIDGTCNFTNLKRMVSLEGWYAPNTKFSHLGGKVSD